MKKYLILVALFVTAICGYKIYTVMQQKAQKEAQKAQQSEGAPRSTRKYPVVPKDAHAFTWDEMKAGVLSEYEKVYIPKELGYVPKHSFEMNPHVRELYLGENICVNPRSFYACPNLKHIYFTGPTDLIESHAFEACPQLQEVSGDIESLGMGAFQDCVQLRKAHFSDRFYCVRDECFSGCVNLQSVLFGIALKVYGEMDSGECANIFKGCVNLQEISIPSNCMTQMFKHLTDSPQLQRIYLLTLEHYPMPTCNIPGFPNQHSILYVPDALLDAYKNDATWSAFGQILPLSESKYYNAEGFFK